MFNDRFFFLSLSSVSMKLEGWTFSMFSSKSLTDVKLFQWNWAGLITITEEILHASCYPKFLRPDMVQHFQFHLCYSKSNPLLKSFTQSFKVGDVSSCSIARRNHSNYYVNTTLRDDSCDFSSIQYL